MSVNEDFPYRFFNGCAPLFVFICERLEEVLCVGGGSVALEASYGAIVCVGGAGESEGFSCR